MPTSALPRGRAQVSGTMGALTSPIDRPRGAIEGLHVEEWHSEIGDIAEGGRRGAIAAKMTGKTARFRTISMF